MLTQFRPKAVVYRRSRSLKVIHVGIDQKAIHDPCYAILSRRISQIIASERGVSIFSAFVRVREPLKSIYCEIWPQTTRTINHTLDIHRTIYRPIGINRHCNSRTDYTTAIVHVRLTIGNALKI